MLDWRYDKTELTPWPDEQGTHHKLTRDTRVTNGEAAVSVSCLQT